MGLLDFLRPRPAGSSVDMVVSVDQYVAGNSYTLPVTLADSLIARGYAKGTLSREFSADELNALTINSQAVTFSG